MPRGAHKHFMRFAYRSVSNSLVFYCEDEGCRGKGSIEFVASDFFLGVKR